MTRREDFCRFARVLHAAGRLSDGQLLTEPGSRDRPVAFDGFWRDAQGIGDFIDGEAAEVTKLHDLCLTCREPSQPFEGFVERFPAIALAGIDQGHGFVERDAALILAATFFAVAAAGVFHEHLAHQVRGDADKPRAIVPVIASLGGEPQVDLVDKGRGLEGMTSAFLPQVVMCQAPQLRVHDRQVFVGVWHLSIMLEVHSERYGDKRPRASR